MVLGSKIRFSAQMSNNAKKYIETPNKTCFEAFWEILENQVLGSKMWFSAQISSKHVLRLFKKFLKIRFSAQKIRFSAQMSNNAKKYFENLRKHKLNTLWGILRIFWKSDSWLKNPVLGSNVE